MIKNFKITYPCFTGPEERRLYVYLPRGYNIHKAKHYPVLYMFDGQNVFFDDNATYGKSWGLGKYLHQTKTPLIVAAYECNCHTDNGRLSEYSPFYYNPQGEWGGPYEPRAQATMEWFINVLKPFIDARFRTLPDRQHTFISGSSMGGLMTLYALLKHNDVFSRGAALSPTLDIDIDQLCQMIQGAELTPDTVLYMDYGRREFDYEHWSRNNFVRAAQLLGSKDILLSTRLVPEGEHNEASWEKQLPFAIPTLMYNI